jgi:hypothetical protein
MTDQRLFTGVASDFKIEARLGDSTALGTDDLL